MTRKEATSLLKSRVDLIKSNYPEIDDYREALEMAIEALEKEPCEDVISRQAVLEMAYDVSEIIKGLESVKKECGTHLDESFAWICEPIDRAIKALEQEPCEDCISRQAVLEWCGDINMDVYTNEVKEYVLSLPPVIPQPKMGRWIIIDDCEQFIAKCSECGRIEDSRMISKYPYCHCGAKMTESEVEE